MPYHRYLVDASHLCKEDRDNVYDFLKSYSDLHSSNPSNPAVFEVFFQCSELELLNSPILAKCRVQKI